jgi:hypothetical protein
MNGPPKLRAATLEEQVAIDNYKEASKASLAAATSYSDKLSTAGFSFATAYGAVIALVAPDDKPEPIVAVLPFVFFAAAVVLALLAQGKGIEADTPAEVSRLQSAVTSAIESKRHWSWAALGSLAIGIVVAGAIINAHYAEPAKSNESTEVNVLLTPAGAESVATACNSKSTSRLQGSVEAGAVLTARRVEIEIAAGLCGEADTDLSLPQSAIAVIASTAAS